VLQGVGSHRYFSPLGLDRESLSAYPQKEAKAPFRAALVAIVAMVGMAEFGNIKIPPSLLNAPIAQLVRYCNQLYNDKIVQE
jgi:hypothetical protein